MNIKDYLHLYGLGSEVLTVDGLGEVLRMYPRGVTIALKGIYLNQQLHGFDEGNGGLHRTYLFKDNPVQLVLRPLSDMTEEEREVWNNMTLAQFQHSTEILAANETLYLLKQHFDLFGLIDAGLAIDKNDLK